jgi:hypothetical protein
MGFGATQAQAALAATGGNNLQAAVDALLQHQPPTQPPAAGGAGGGPAPAAAATAATAAADAKAALLLSMLGLSSDRKFWASTDKKGLDDNKLFAVQPGSAEHAAVCARFAATLPQATIDQLERVENGYMHEQFALTAANQEKQVGGYDPQTMRQMLFHGALPSLAAPHGCLPLLPPIDASVWMKNVYGRGTASALELYRTPSLPPLAGSMLTDAFFLSFFLSFFSCTF